MDNYKFEDATHNLSCRHAIGRNGCNYYMKCIIIKKTKAGNLKLVVFGERNWKGKEHVKQVRYVPPERVTPIKGVVI